MSKKWEEEEEDEYFTTRYSPSESAMDIFDDQLFLKTLKETSNKEIVDEMKKVITLQTYDCIKKECYLMPNGQKIQLRRQKLALEVENTLFHTEKNLDRLADTVFSETEVEIEVVNEDYLEVAERLKNEEGLQPCIVMGVSSKEPGGTFIKDGTIGVEGLEEDAYRRTTLFNALTDPNNLMVEIAKGEREWEYKIPEFGGIYSGTSFIFRRKEDDGFAFMPKPIKVAFLLQIPLKRVKCQKLNKNKFNQPREPIYHDDEEERNKKHVEYKYFFDPFQLNKKYEEKLDKKLNVIFQIVRKHRHDSIVFTPGFVALASPPFHVAYILKNVIEKNFKNDFKKIVIPVCENEVLDKSSNFRFGKWGHFEPFRHAFFPELEIDEPKLKKVYINPRYVEKKELRIRDRQRKKFVNVDENGEEMTPEERRKMREERRKVRASMRSERRYEARQRRLERWRVDEEQVSRFGSYKISSKSTISPPSKSSSPSSKRGRIRGTRGRGRGRNSKREFTSPWDDLGDFEKGASSSSSQKMTYERHNRTNNNTRPRGRGALGSRGRGRPGNFDGRRSREEGEQEERRRRREQQQKKEEEEEKEEEEKERRWRIEEARRRKKKELQLQQKREEQEERRKKEFEQQQIREEQERKRRRREEYEKQRMMKKKFEFSEEDIMNHPMFNTKAYKEVEENERWIKETLQSVFPSFKSLKEVENFVIEESKNLQIKKEFFEKYCKIFSSFEKKMKKGKE